MARLIVLLLVCSLLVPLWLSAHQDNSIRVPEVVGQKGQISGRVLGDEGVALDGATVRLRRTDSGQETVSKCDREGQFAFKDVASGWYGVAASQPGYAPLAYGAARPRAAGTPLVLPDDTGLGALTIRLPRAAVVSGAVRRPDGTPLGGISVAVLEKTITAAGVRAFSSVDSVMTDDRGAYRIANIPPGQFVLKATPPRAAISSAEAPSTNGKASVSVRGYATTFYPSVLDEQGALQVVLSNGERLDRADILLRVVPLVRVGGRILDGGGASVTGGDVVLIQPESTGSAPTVATVLISSGTFILPNVPPGHYLLRANRPASGPTASLRASQAVSVTAGTDVLDLSLLLQPTAAVNGRVVFVGDGPPPSAASLRVGLYNAPGPVTSAVAAVVSPDGSLRFSSVEAGRYSIRTSSTAMTGAWSLASVLVDQEEVVDSSFEISVGQSIENVTLTFTNRLGQLSGSVLDRAGAAATDFTVVAFPDDRRLWSAFRRRVFATRPANTGQFQINSMPPGTYRVAAARDPEPNEWLLPEFLETLVQGSVRVAVTTGKTIQNLQIGR